MLLCACKLIEEANDVSSDMAIKLLRYFCVSDTKS